VSSEKDKRKSVVIFGAGIAGLSAAHELILLGYDVSVYEATDQPGGFFRSSRLSKNNMPTEYSWHGMGPWYHNTFDLMRKTPFNDKGSIYDVALSRPIDFGIFPDAAKAQFYDEGFKSIPKMFRMSIWDFVKWSYLMLKTWTSNQRNHKYSKLNAAQTWRPLLEDTAYRTWRSCFGPWIGSDWSRVSLHTAGDFFRKQLTTKPAHSHKADPEGPAWMHRAGDGWLLLKGPSSEYWFTPWVNYLTQKGVKFHWEKPLVELEFNGTLITCAVAGDEKITADAFIIAINPFHMAEILSKTPQLEAQEVLRLFRPLTQDGPHTQVSFRLAFSDRIKFPRKRAAVVVSDSEFNLTLFAQEQVWENEVALGANVKSLWTGTSCISSVPGRIYHKPVENCTKEEFIEEVRAQIYGCGALNALIQEANHGKSLCDFTLLEIEVWHEWAFCQEGIKHFQPKWVTSTTTQPYMPSQTTPIPNLFLAGSHTANQANVWSIEGAVETGRRAAKAIDPRVGILGQYKPAWIHFLSGIDDFLYAFKVPQAIDFLFLFVFIGSLLLFL
jgi:uncharacterized protein with NAD-binding domain and iron-sulfur cluster